MLKLRIELAVGAILKWISKQLTFTKFIVAYLLYKSVSWIDQSYALAWAGNVEIAESLSQVALTEVIAVFALYAAKSLFTSLSEHNDWPDKPYRPVKSFKESDNSIERDC